jgi:hypothetical protein
MEKPKTFITTYRISIVCTVLSGILSIFVNKLDAGYYIYHPGWVEKIWIVAVLFLYLWFLIQIKNAKDWARIVFVFYAIFAVIFMLLNHNGFINENPPEKIEIVISETIFFCIDLIQLFAALLPFSKKSNEYIRFQYAIKQDLKNKNLK